MVEQKLLQLTIARVDGPVFDGEVTQVQVPGVDGDMTILANHEALISPLRAGKLIVTKSNGETETQEITAGTLEISDNHVIILIWVDIKAKVRLRESNSVILWNLNVFL